MDKFNQQGFGWLLFNLLDKMVSTSPMWFSFIYFVLHYIKLTLYGFSKLLFIKILNRFMELKAAGL